MREYRSRKRNRCGGLCGFQFHRFSSFRPKAQTQAARLSLHPQPRLGMTWKERCFSISCLRARPLSPLVCQIVAGVEYRQSIESSSLSLGTFKIAMSEGSSAMNPPTHQRIVCMVSGASATWGRTLLDRFGACVGRPAPGCGAAIGARYIPKRLPRATNIQENRFCFHDFRQYSDSWHM